MVLQNPYSIYGYTEKESYHNCSNYGTTKPYIICRYSERESNHNCSRYGTTTKPLISCLKF